MGSDKRLDFKNLCQDTPHNITPIFKVVVHRTDTTLYVFVGHQPECWDLLQKIEKHVVLTDKEKRKIASKYGWNWESAFGLKLRTSGSVTKIKFHKDTIYDDEPVAAARARISTLLGCEQGEVYMWCNRVIRDTTSYWRTIIEEWAYNRKAFMGSSLKMLVNNVCTRDDMLKNVQDTSLLTVDEAVAALTSTPKDTAAKQKIKKEKKAGLKAKETKEKESKKTVKEVPPRAATELFANVPLGFRYVQNGHHVFFPVHPARGAWSHDPNEALALIDETTKHLEYYGPFMRMIHVIQKKDLSLVSDEGGNNVLYYPKLNEFSTMKLRNDDDFDARYLETAMRFQNQCQIGFAQFRNVVGVPLELSVLNIDRAFNDISLRNKNGIVFAKKITRTSGNLIKMAKSIVSHEMKPTILNWVKATTFKRGVLCNSLTLQLNLEKLGLKSYTTLSILSNGTCDLKVRAQHKTLEKMDKTTLIEVIKFANKIIAEIAADGNTHIIPFDDKVISEPMSSSTTRVISMTIGSSFAAAINTPMPGLATLQKAIASTPYLSNAFAVQAGSDQLLHLVYKRVNDFASEKQIREYVTRQAMLKENTIKPEDLVSLFGVSTAEAKSYLKSKQNANKVLPSFRKKRTVISSAADVLHTSLLRIKIQKVMSGYRFMCDGVVHENYYKRIVRLLKVLCNTIDDGSRDKKKTIKKKVVVKKESTNSDAEDVEDEDVDNDTVDIEANTNLVDDDGFGDDDLGLGDWWLNLENDVKLDADANNKKKGDDSLLEPRHETNDDDTGVGGYSLLQDLMRADAELFTVRKQSGLKSYARKCQAASNQQPVVVTDEDLKRLDHSSFTKPLINHRGNNYICPDVWCPISRISMSREQYAKSKKCPNENEKAMLFWDDVKDKGKKRYIGLMSAKDHHANLCMPCCYKTQKKITEGCMGQKVADAADKGNIKYILSTLDTLPTTAGRYAYLPEILSKYLMNKKIENKGALPKDYSGFFRHGLETTEHPFLTVMAQTLGNDALKNEGDVIDAIINNLDMVTFMSLYNGNLIKKFVSMVNPNDIYTSAFIRFRSDFIADQAYQKTFSVGFLQSFLKKTAQTFSTNWENADIIKREFTFWAAFEAFKTEYMKNKNIVKTHEFLLDIFQMQLPWLNVHGYNIIVFEAREDGEVLIPCVPVSDMRPNREFILVLKGDRYYEAIYNLSVKDELGVTRRFFLEDFEPVKKIVKYMEKAACATASKVKLSKYTSVILMMQEQIDAFVLDYDFQIVGILLQSNVLLPLPEPIPLSPRQVSEASLMFVDDALSSRIAVVSEKTVRATIKDFNERFGSNVIVLSGEVTKIKNFKMIKVVNFKQGECGLDYIPLTTATGVKEALKLVDDMHMLASMEITDDRIRLMNNLRLTDVLKRSMWNEVMRYMKRKPSVLQTIKFLRNEYNPIPRKIKLMLLTSELKEHLARIYRESNESKKELREISFHNKHCTSIPSSVKCVGQCTWKRKAKADHKSGNCYLGVPPELVNTVISGVLMDLVNVNVPMKQLTVIEKKDEGEVLLFTDTDIKTGRLNKVFDQVDGADQWGFKSREEAIDDTKFFAMVPEKVGLPKGNNDFVKTDTFGKLPTNFPKVAGKDHFKMAVVNGHNPMRLFDQFAAIYNVVHGHSGQVQMTGERMKENIISKLLKSFKEDEQGTLLYLEYNPTVAAALAKQRKKSNAITLQDVKEALAGQAYYPSKRELHLMAELCNVNVFVFCRQNKPRNPANFYCVGKVSNPAYHVIMRQEVESAPVKYDEFSFIIRDDGKRKKTLFEVDEFRGDELGQLLREQCKKVVVMAQRH